jgi:hypothetical protein
MPHATTTRKWNGRPKYTARLGCRVQILTRVSGGGAEEFSGALEELRELLGVKD